MLSEYEVRTMVQAIEASDASPMSKTRALLSLVQTLRKQLASIRRGGMILEGDLDLDAAARLSRLERQTERLMEDVRLAALHALRNRRQKIGFETAPTFSAVMMPPRDIATPAR
jgi:hypothetical protein